MIGIYKITSPTKRIYIGKSKNIKKRHQSYKRLDCVKQVKLYNSFIKHGVNNHIFETIEECSVEDLNERELYWQDYYDVLKNGLNCNTYNYKEKKFNICEESKNRRSESKKGEKNPMFGRCGEKHFHFGKKATDEHKKNLSENSGQAKLVLNLETGIFYKSLTEACITHNLNYGSMMNRLQGYRKNYTSLIFV